MKLVRISNNFLVNVNSITYVEQRTVKGKTVVYVGICDGREEELEIPVKEFMAEVESSDPVQQYHAL